MERTEAIEWMKSIKKKYIHGGDDFYDHQRRTAIDYAIVVLENIEQPKTNADRIRAMDDELLATQIVQVIRETIEVLTKLETPDSLLNKIRTQILEKLKEQAEGE